MKLKYTGKCGGNMTFNNMDREKVTSNKNGVDQKRYLVYYH